jgi:Zn-dependent oligopeptidase
MSLDNLLDGKTIAMGALASLVGYVFYGFINLQAKVDTMEAKQEQVMSEQRDLWSKYNADLDKKLDFLEDYMQTKVDNEKRWAEYWKEKYENKK